VHGRTPAAVAQDTILYPTESPPLAVNRLSRLFGLIAKPRAKIGTVRTRGWYSAALGCSFDSMLTNAQVRILKAISPGNPRAGKACAYDGKSKLVTLLGNDFFARIAGKVVIDFGCGEGAESIEMARNGAAQVIGLDIRESVLQKARAAAVQAGVRNCVFTGSTDVSADVIVTVDAFEHYDDPEGVLRTMGALLRPDGEVVISFGWPWYHPMGGHLFSVFPWAHLVFSEKALIRWRSAFKTDGATCFGEVAGGLNQMTISRFEKLVAASPFEFASFELAPIRKLQRLHNRLTREFTTSTIRCRLRWRP
jgi:SAM-dependent methyltransferase